MNSHNRGRAFQRLQEYVASRGGEILTQGFLRAVDRVDVRCSCGFEWNVGVGPLYQQKTWCPRCAGHLPRSLEQLQGIAEARGGRVLSTEYFNVDSTYDFECSLGHQFSNTFKHVVGRGQWCPTCNRPTKSEEIARQTFHQIFNTPFRKSRPDWLRNERGYRMELDGYSEQLGVAFEYQGIQHFKEFSLFSTDLGKRMDDDAKKALLCREHGVHLVTLTYEDEYSEFPGKIKSQLESLGFDCSMYDFSKPINLDNAYIRDDRLEELRRLLEPKNIEVLSSKWLTTDTKYELLCKVCGHEWSARGNAFFNSRSVAGCDKCNRAKVGERTKLGLKPLREFARKHGGKLLSTIYVRRIHHYKWECKKGHVFERNFNDMVSRDLFCWECEGSLKKSVVLESEARRRLSERGFEIASPYNGFSKSIQLLCRECKTTITTTTARQINSKQGCTNCSKNNNAAKAEARLRAAGYEPLEPYRNSNSSWKARCIHCGQISRPFLSNVAKGSRCRFCRGKGLRAS